MEFSVGLTFSDLKSVWRILVAVAGFQLVGGAIGLAIRLHHFGFMNFWFGGATATLPGFAVGLAWQLKSTKDRGLWTSVAWFLGIISFVLTAVAIGFVFPMMRGEMRLIRATAEMPAEALYRIDVFDEDGNKMIASISDAESLQAFARGIADVVGYTPNHPMYSHSWYVVVYGAARHEFQLHLDPNVPQYVDGRFVALSKSGGSTSIWSYGSFRSKGLRPWVEKHLMGGDGNKRVEAPR